jgi:hypothetical protein
LGRLTLSVYLLFDFIFALPLSLCLAIINFFSDKKRDLLFFQLNIVGIFGDGLIFFRSLEEAISARELSEEVQYSGYLMQVLVREVTGFESWYLK